MTENVGDIEYTVSADTASLLVADRQVAAANQKMQQGFNKTDVSVNKVSDSFMKLSRVAVAVSSALSAREVLEYANAWVELNNKLANSVRGLETLGDVTQRVFDIAQNSRASLSSTAGLYAKLERATRGSGTGTKQLAQLTETINKAFVVSGASAEEAAGAIQQLSQGLGSGVLRGEEFNSVMENGSRLALALADSLGVDLGQLREMASQGKLTTDVVVNGLLKQGDAIGKEFENTIVTMGQAWTVATNNITKFVGESTAVQSMVSGINDVIITTSENLESLSSVFVALAAVMGSRFVGALTASSLSMIKNAVAARELAVTENQVAQASANQAAASLRAAEVTKVRAIEEIRLAEMMKITAFNAGNSAAAEARLSAARVAAATATGNYNKALVANAGAQVAAATAAKAASAATGLMRGAMALVGGPAGAAMLAASAIFYFYQKSKEAREEAIKLADGVDTLTAKMQDMSQVELSANIGKLRTALPELKGAVKDAQEEFQKATNHVNNLQKEVKNWGTGTTRGRQAAEALTGAMDEQAVAAYNLEKAENQLSQSQNAIGMMQAQANGQFKQGIELLQRNGESAGVAAGLYKQFGDALNFTAKAQENFNSSSIMVQRDPKVQGMLDDLQSENDLLHETSLRKREQLKVEQQLRAKGASEADIRLARERAGANYDLAQAEKERNNVVKASASAENKAAQEEKRRAEQLQDQKDALAVNTLEMQGMSREAAQLAAVQKLGAGATQAQIRSAEAQAGAIFDTTQAIKDQQDALKQNPLAGENRAYADMQTQLERQLAGNLITQEEYAARSEKIAVEHQQNLAKIAAEQVVTPKQTAAAAVDPVQALENENAKKIALIKEYESARIITTTQADALIAAEKTKNDQQRLAALEQMYRAQSTLNDFTMSMIDVTAQRFGNMITGMVMGTQSAQEAFRNLAATILNQAVNALIQLGVQQIKNALIGEAVDAASKDRVSTQVAEAEAATAAAEGIAAAANRRSIAAATVTGKSIAAAYAGAAAMVSLATMGANAVAAEAGIATVMASTKAAAVGGRRYGGGVSGGSMYRVNENGQSEVFQTSAGQQMFIPGKTGQVIPADEVGGGALPVNVVINNMASGTTVENQGYNPDTRTIQLAVKEVERQLRTRTGGVSRAISDSWNVTGKAK